MRAMVIPWVGRHDSGVTASRVSQHVRICCVVALDELGHFVTLRIPADAYNGWCNYEVDVGQSYKKW